MDISFILVNYNTKQLTSEAIDSIYKFAKDMVFEIILVDNASSDGSVPYLKKRFPKIQIIESKENIGFGPANNLAAKEAKGEYLYFFNSDAYLLDDSTKNLLQRAKEISNLGAISPLILNRDETIQQSGGYFPTLLKVFWWMSFFDDLPFGLLLNPYHIDHDKFYSKERELDWLTGAAFLIPRAVFEKIGGFDQRIFMYGEDVELCYRIKQSGFKVLMSPVSKVIHIGQGSSGKISKNAILGEYKGIIYFYSKHKGNISLQILRLLLKIGALLRFLVFGSLGRKELSRTYIEAYKSL